jgi:uncharacterized membrane protein
MRLRLFAFLHKIQESYWFVPSLMALGAAVLSVVLVTADHRLGAEWIRDVSWLYANEAEGARAMLSTIAGSVISVAGVTFSITIAALSLASSQYGPRLVSGFMRDRGNQFVLGTYTATFIYCLLLLRTIRDMEPGPGMEPTGFVPHLAILVGLGLAILSVAVLIYFINHVSQSIRVSHVVHQVSRELERRIDHILSQEGAPPGETDGEKALDVPDEFDERATQVRAKASGYVQAIDDDDLMRLAVRHDLLIQVHARPGDFVVKDGELLRVLGDAERLQARLHDTYVMGTRRTDAQDPIALLQQLVEVAARAMSPGVNDPFTAVVCIDWITSALARLAIEHIPSAYRYDRDGELRLIFAPMTFGEFADAAYDPLREYGREMVEIDVRLLQSIEAVGDRALLPANRDTLERHARRIYDDAMDQLSNAGDRDRVEKQFRATMTSVLRDGATAAPARETLYRVPHEPERL